MSEPLRLSTHIISARSWIMRKSTSLLSLCLAILSSLCWADSPAYFSSYRTTGFTDLFGLSFHISSTRLKVHRINSSFNSFILTNIFFPESDSKSLGSYPIRPLRGSRFCKSVYHCSDPGSSCLIFHPL